MPPRKKATAPPPSPRMVEVMLQKAPPHDMEAEQSVLGAIMYYKRAMEDLSDKLRPEDFYSPAHGAIWAAALDLFRTNTPVDLVTVCDALTKRKQLDAAGGPVYLAELADTPVSSVSAKYHADIVSEHAMRRDIESSCLGMLKGVRDSAVTVQDLVGSSTRALAEDRKSVV